MATKTIKDKLSKGRSKLKAKIDAKVKAAKKSAPMAVLVASAAIMSGCLDTAPASRATSASYGDIVVKIGDKAKDNKVTITLGDGALASADSSGSTETQTATPTMDIRPNLIIKYNDAIAGATAASRSVLGTIGTGLDAVLELMQSKKSGKVEVTKTDGTSATVQCDNGQCEFCEDCSE